MSSFNVINDTEINKISLFLVIGVLLICSS